jgi:hypothetical protein
MRHKKFFCPESFSYRVLSAGSTALDVAKRIEEIALCRGGLWNSVLIAVVLFWSQGIALAETSTFSRIRGEGYALELPSDWVEQSSPYSLGPGTRLFVPIAKKRGGGGGCSIQSLPITKELNPELAALTREQRRELFASGEWGLDMWKYVLPNLPSSLGLEVVTDVPVSLSQPPLPARQIEYKSYVPQGYYYYSRAIYTITDSMQFILLCMGIGLNASDAHKFFGANQHLFFHAKNTLRLQ